MDKCNPRFLFVEKLYKTIYLGSTVSSAFPDLVNRCNFYFHTTSVSYVSRDIGFRMISREVEKELVLKIKITRFNYVSKRWSRFYTSNR